MEKQNFRDLFIKLQTEYNRKLLKKIFYKGSHTESYFSGHTAGVYAVQVTLICGAYLTSKLEDDTVITASGDKSIRVWNSKTKECIKELKGHTSGVCCLHYDKDEQRIVSGSWDKTIRFVVT